MRAVAMLDFPLEEYRERLRKLMEEMARAGVDGAMITQHENLRYFTGLRSSDWGVKDANPGVLFVAADGRMAMVGAESALPAMADTCCLDAEPKRSGPRCAGSACIARGWAWNPAWSRG